MHILPIVPIFHSKTRKQRLELLLVVKMNVLNKSCKHDFIERTVTKNTLLYFKFDIYIMIFERNAGYA